MILGLDISTNSTGYAILKRDKELVSYGNIDTSKAATYYDKAEKFYTEIKEVINENRPEETFIEDIMSKFSSGRSSIKTIIALARFNGMASYMCYIITKHRPIHLNVLRARKLALGHQVPRGENSKEYCCNVVKNWYPDIVFPMMKRKDKLAGQAYDIADSIIIARAGLNNE